MSKLLEIGWEEWIALPELKIPAILAKVDTGAKTSALHAFHVEKILEGGDIKVRFGIHPIPKRPDIEIYCNAHLVDEREVVSSNGQAEIRYVIRTLAQFGKKKWPIEITLTDRETMAYRMLIGRSAMEGRMVVVPEMSFRLGMLGEHLYKHIPERRHKKRQRICVLSRTRNNYSTDRLVTVAEDRGHTVEVINTTRCYVDINSNKPTIHYQGRQLTQFDAIIPRIGPSITIYGMAVLRQFESLGTYCINSSAAISHSRDRLLTHQLLDRAGIAMPTTAFAHYPGNTKDMINMVGGTPLVVKLLDGSHGKGAVLAETPKAASAVIQVLRGLKANFIVQEYAKGSIKKDIHCMVLGTKIIGAIEKIFPETELSGHLSKEGTLPVKLTASEQKMALRAVRVLGLKFASVNLLRTKEGPRILDVNASPGFRTIERVAGVDVATLLIEYLETHARPKFPKRIVGVHI